MYMQTNLGNGVNPGDSCTYIYDVRCDTKGNGQQYGILKDYLLIDDEWGTHRGYIWRIGIECYMKYSPLRKMFGSGPDTFGIVTQSYYREMIERYYEIFDSAHNEYLQYLITIGIVGLFSYLFFISVFYNRNNKGFKKGSLSYVNCICS